jgi:hypothetical protein
MGALPLHHIHAKVYSYYTPALTIKQDGIWHLSVRSDGQRVGWVLLAPLQSKAG